MTVELTPAERDLLFAERRAVLATINERGTARLVPIAYAPVLDDGLRIYSALDEKPKSVSDPRDLARVRDIRERPRVTLLVDRWDETWSALAWLRMDGTATLIEATDAAAGGHSDAVRLLRERYPQYATHALEQRPVIRIDVDHVASWFAS
ncbi:MAG TPA: pyridoxamine 5'-phosphate oxidase family protein [Candidatus Limnocylindrales bacterium]|jgi:PPOX class probable F420-dependent enzyme|nr:pyridoxamine 5'-phosphate oxidase family protein [Candidatus Limnocylindrales bacterium]